MAFNLFGYEIKRKGKESKEESDALNSPIQPEEEGAAVVSGTGLAGFYGESVSVAGSDFKSEQELIRKYRKAILHPEVEAAVDEIMNQAIITDDNARAVELKFSEESELSDDMKKKITEQFEYIYSLMNFQEYGYDYFRNWYIDGRLAFYKNVGNTDKPQTIKSIQPIDALKIRKIKKVETDKTKNGVPIISDIKIYYEYSQKGFGEGAKNAIQLTSDSVTYITSGLLDENRKYTLSHLHKAMKPINQLSMIEDAIVIYRISRAPERRIFYIDVGNLPRQKAEQYVKDIMNRYRNKLIYNPQTGEVDDTRKYQTMLEDYWLPRREGGKGTQVDTLPGGQAMNQIDDLEYFLRKVYKSLNVPFNRFQGENSAFATRATEVTRDELKFSRFVQRLRSRFAQIFYDILRTQLLLKKVVDTNEWERIKDQVYFDFNKDSYFAESKEAEMLQQRLQMLRDANEYVGRYFSLEYIQRNILHMTLDEIEEMDKQIKKEKSAGKIPKEEEQGRMF